MTLRRFFKYSLAGLAAFLVLYFATGTTGTMSYTQRQKTLGTNEEPLMFMARSIRPGMSRSEVAKIVRGYSGVNTRPPDQFGPGGTDVYIYHLQFAGRWKWFGESRSIGEYGRIWVHYEADGRVRDAQTDVGD